MSSPRTLAALTGGVLVLPFLFLEVWNNGFHLARGLDYLLLFGILWTLPAAVVITTAWLVQTRRQNAAAGYPLVFGLTIALVLFAGAWAAIVTDQWPCFTGSANCD